jgi:hypothetical protein
VARKPPSQRHQTIEDEIGPCEGCGVVVEYCVCGRRDYTYDYGEPDPQTEESS